MIRGPLITQGKRFCFLEMTLKKKEAFLFLAVFIKFLETGVVFEVFFTVWNGGEKNLAADYDEFFPRPRHDHIKAVGIIQEPGCHMASIRCGEPEDDHIPFRTLNPLHRINERQLMVRSLKEMGKVGGDSIVLSAMGGD